MHTRETGCSSGTRSSSRAQTSWADDLPASSHRAIARWASSSTSSWSRTCGATGRRPFRRLVRARAPVVEGHFEDHDDRGQRRPGRTRDEARHARQRERGRVDMQAGKPRAQRHAERGAQVAPVNSDGENTPPDAPDPSVTEVATSFSAKNIRSNPAPVILPDRMSKIVA